MITWGIPWTTHSRKGSASLLTLYHFLCKYFILSPNANARFFLFNTTVRTTNDLYIIFWGKPCYICKECDIYHFTCIEQALSCKYCVLCSIDSMVILPWSVNMKIAFVLFAFRKHNVRNPVVNAKKLMEKLIVEDRVYFLALENSEKWKSRKSRKMKIVHVTKIAYLANCLWFSPAKNDQKIKLSRQHKHNFTSLSICITLVSLHVLLKRHKFKTAGFGACCYLNTRANYLNQTWEFVSFITSPRFYPEAVLWTWPLYKSIKWNI